MAAGYQRVCLHETPLSERVKEGIVGYNALSSQKVSVAVFANSLDSCEIFWFLMILIVVDLD